MTSNQSNELENLILLDLKFDSHVNKVLYIYYMMGKSCKNPVLSLDAFVHSNSHCLLIRAFMGTVYWGLAGSFNSWFGSHSGQCLVPVFVRMIRQWVTYTTCRYLFQAEKIDEFSFL